MWLVALQKDGGGGTNSQEVEVDIDELLDMDTDDHRRRHLTVRTRYTSAPITVLLNATEALNLFITSFYYLYLHAGKISRQTRTYPPLSF